MKTLVVIAALFLTGCSTTYTGHTTSTPSNTQYIRDANGMTQARIRDGNVYNTQGIRTHRIDNQGNIYTTRSGNGKFAGERVGKISR